MPKLCLEDKEPHKWDDIYLEAGSWTFTHLGESNITVKQDNFGASSTLKYMKSSWNLFHDCSVSEVQHLPSSPIIFYFLKWSVNAVKTLGCSFQTMIRLRRSKFRLLSCLQKPGGLSIKSSGGWGFFSFSLPYFGAGGTRRCVEEKEAVTISHCVLVT